jgi:hypothetical protein
VVFGPMMMAGEVRSPKSMVAEPARSNGGMAS